jgi:hypothetical protein
MAARCRIARFRRRAGSTASASNQAHKCNRRNRDRPRSEARTGRSSDTGRDCIRPDTTDHTDRPRKARRTPARYCTSACSDFEDRGQCCTYPGKRAHTDCRRTAGRIGARHCTKGCSGSEDKGQCCIHRDIPHGTGSRRRADHIAEAWRGIAACCSNSPGTERASIRPRSPMRMRPLRGKAGCSASSDRRAHRYSQRCTDVRRDTGVCTRNSQGRRSDYIRPDNTVRTDFHRTADRTAAPRCRWSCNDSAGKGSCCIRPGSLGRMGRNSSPRCTGCRRTEDRRAHS